MTVCCAPSLWTVRGWSGRSQCGVFVLLPSVGCGTDPHGCLPGHVLRSGNEQVKWRSPLEAVGPAAGHTLEVGLSPG